MFKDSITFEKPTVVINNKFAVDWVENEALAAVEKYNLDTENTLIYACGHPGMIEDVKEKWVPNGFKVEEERFWKED